MASERPKPEDRSLLIASHCHDIVLKSSSNSGPELMDNVKSLSRCKKCFVKRYDKFGGKLLVLLWVQMLKANIFQLVFPASDS
uniref:Uncharacterized protein n=1 Tax=Oryza rufipogon TaxID=4529 RepID=A0A0E0QJW7_ORYRU